MLLKDITILILTYNRYKYLERILTYYKLCNVNCNIFILDSSTNKVIKNNRLKSLLNQEQVTWLKFTSDTFISCKIAEGLEKVDTKFSVLCADDDFVLPKGIAKCVDFLNCNPSYISAQGGRMIHQLLPNGIVKRNGWAPYRKSIINKCPEKRFLALFEKQYASYPYYAVYRRDAQLEIWKKASSLSANGFMEILPVALSLIHGKTKILKTIYLSSEANRFSWMTEEKFKDLYKEDFVKQYQIIIEESLQSFICGYQMSKGTLKVLLKPFKWQETNKGLWNKIYRRVVAILEKIKVALNPKIYKAAELKLVDSLIKEFNLDDEEIVASRKDY